MLPLKKQAMGDGAAIVAYIMKPSRVEDFAKVITIFKLQFSNVRGLWWSMLTCCLTVCWLYICFIFYVVIDSWYSYGAYMWCSPC